MPSLVEQRRQPPYVRSTQRYLNPSRRVRWMASRQVLGSFCDANAGAGSSAGVASCLSNSAPGWDSTEMSSSLVNR